MVNVWVFDQSVAGFVAIACDDVKSTRRKTNLSGELCNSQQRQAAFERQQNFVVVVPCFPSESMCLRTTLVIWL